MQIVAAILRFFQILFAAVVLGLSVNLAKGQAGSDDWDWLDHHVPATTSYSAFTGGFGMFVALIGFVSLFVDFLQGIIMLVLDTLAGICLLAGGIAVAVGLRGTSCGNPQQMFNNDLLNGGCGIQDKIHYCKYGDGSEDTLKSRCKMDEADSAFMFLAFFVCAGLVAHTFFFGGRTALGGKRVSAV